MSASTRRIADARDVVDALYVIAKERAMHGESTPFHVTAKELATRCQGKNFTPMRVGHASLEAVQTLRRLGWQVAYEELRGVSGGIKAFVVTRAITLNSPR